MKSSKRTRQALCSAVMAVSVGGVASHAWGQATNTYPFSANFMSEVETSGPYTSANSGPSYVDINGAAEKYTNYNIIQFNTAGGQFANTLATAVNPNFTVALTDNDYSGSSGETTEPTNLNFFLVDDANTDISTDGGSPLIYEPSGALGGGLTTPGATGGFPAGDHIYYLGSWGWQGAGTGAVNTIPLSLDNATMNATGSQNIAAANSYLLTQVQNSQAIRLLVTTSNTDNTFVAYNGYASGTGPLLNLSVTATPPTPNNSTIYLTSPPAGSTPNNIPNLNLGRVVEGAASFTSTLTVGNPSGTSGGALILASPNNGLDGSAAPSTAIAPGGMGTITVGFSSGDTSGYEAGYEATGNLNFTDANDTASIISVAASALVVDQRVITAGGTGHSPSPAAINAKKILVGATGSVSVTLSTTNSNSNLPAGQYGPGYLTTETLAASATSSPYTIDDPFSSTPVATISATANNAYVFDNGTADTNGVTGFVKVAVSGQYGDAHTATIGTQTAFFNGSYTAFSAAFGLSNDGTTAGEKDYADVYLQWEGYQAAAVSGPLVPVSANSTVTLTNAATNDNTDSTNGLRGAAWVISITPNQTWTGGGGWSLSSGISAPTSPPTSAGTNGTVINGSQSLGDTNSYSASATVNFTPTNQMINGTYGGTISVGLENEQDIQGTSSNDLAPVLFNVQNGVVSQPSGTGAGTYTLNAGTLAVTLPTILTGSFTQSGGSSTFASIVDTGTVAINGGSITVSSLSISGSGKMVLANNVTLATKAGTPPTSTVNLASVSIIGNGTLDIGNNHIIIDYTPGNDPIASIAALIDSGANLISGVPTWTGKGITSAAAQTTAGSYGIGYADAADPGNPAGLLSGQIEVMYTLLGDANLDGKVNGTDFNILAANFNTGGDRWDQGDFTYDGKVNGSDFNLLAENFNQGATLAANQAALDSFAGANGISLTSVPEPASLGALAISGIAMLSRRKRRSIQ